MQTEKAVFDPTKPFRTRDGRKVDNFRGRNSDTWSGKVDHDSRTRVWDRPSGTHAFGERNLDLVNVVELDVTKLERGDELTVRVEFRSMENGELRCWSKRGGAGQLFVLPEEVVTWPEPKAEPLKVGDKVVSDSYASIIHEVHGVLGDKLWVSDGDGRPFTTPAEAWKRAA